MSFNLIQPSSLQEIPPTCLPIFHSYVKPYALVAARLTLKLLRDKCLNDVGEEIFRNLPTFRKLSVTLSPLACTWRCPLFLMALLLGFGAWITTTRSLSAAGLSPVAVIAKNYTHEVVQQEAPVYTDILFAAVNLSDLLLGCSKHSVDIHGGCEESMQDHYHTALDNHKLAVLQSTVAFKWLPPMVKYVFWIPVTRTLLRMRESVLQTPDYWTEVFLPYTSLQSGIISPHPAYLSSLDDFSSI